MIHFTSLMAQQSFMQAISEPVTGNQLLFKVMQLVNRDNPAVIRLHVGRKDDLGQYFDFDVHRVPVDVYVDGDGAARPDLTEMPNFRFTPATRLVNGGLVRRTDGWSSHT